MSMRMLIDARHPEETRVAVVKGNRIEEFDFESSEHKQLKGNIYLAKVTRVEPSLQAAFIDYGGNRHGFLAFSEIHPDYYQIPKADRDALLRLAESSPVRLCADESAGSLAAVVGFVGTRVGGVSLKLIKHGGMTGVMRGAAICSAGGLGINLAGKVIESSVSAAANLHCAAAMDRVDFGCSPANQGVILDVTHTPITVDNGEFPLPDGPGLGIEVDEDLVEELSS